MILESFGLLLFLHLLELIVKTLVHGVDGYFFFGFLVQGFSLLPQRILELFCAQNHGVSLLDKPDLLNLFRGQILITDGKKLLVEDRINLFELGGSKHCLVYHIFNV